MRYKTWQLFILVFIIVNNSSAQWTSLGLSGKSIYSIASIGDIIIVGTQNEGIYRTTNDGTTWSQVSDVDLKLTSVEALKISGSMLIAGTNIVGRATYYSIDSGASWVPVNSIINDYTSAIVLKQDTILLGTLNSGVYRSTDQGNTWLNVCPSDSTPKNVLSLLWSENTIYVGTHTNFGGVWKSSDLGDTWVMANSGLPKYPGNIWMDIPSLISYGQFIFAGSNGAGCYRSSDAGTHWDSVNSGLPQNAGVYSLSSNEETLYLGTYGVYQSTDYGNHWLSISNNLPTGHPVMSLYISNGSIYAGIYGNGLWKLPLSSSDVKSNANNLYLDGFILNQNYPNPFNSSTTISFGIASKSQVTLKIYDLLGREVASLINNETMSPGIHFQQWNALNISSGIYFYRLQAGTFTESKKLILLR